MTPPFCCKVRLGHLLIVSLRKVATDTFCYENNQQLHPNHIFRI